MTLRIRENSIALIGWVLLSLCLVPLRVAAEEPSADFLRQLRQHGFLSQADAYLDRMEASPFVSASFQQTIPFERAVNLAESAKTCDPQSAINKMSRAYDQFKLFATENPDSSDFESAVRWQRNVRVQLARTQVALARSKDGKARDQLYGESLTNFRGALRLFNAEAERLKEELADLQSQPNAADDPAELERLGQAYLESRMTAAAIRFEMAEPQKENPRKYAQQLDLAERGYKELSETYRRRVVGRHALFLRGRCLEELGKKQQALGLYRELLDPSEQPPVMVNISAQAAARSIDCMSEDPRQIGAAIDVGEQWFQNVKGSDYDSPEVMQLRLSLGRAYCHRAQTGGNSRRMQAAAKKYLVPVANSDLSLQVEAKELLASFESDTDVVSAVEITDDVRELKDYNQASRSAAALLDRLKTASGTLRLYQSRLSETEDPLRREEIEQGLEVAQEQVLQDRRLGLAMYRRSLELAPRDLPAEERCRLLYLCSYLLYHDDQYLSAVVTGEFAARRLSDQPSARSAAMLVLASYFKLYEERKLGSPDEAQAISQNLVEISRFIATRWPDAKETQEALLTLIRFMAAEGELAQLQEYLDRIPADSPRRGSAELIAGQALWTHYQRLRAASADPSTSVSSEALDQLLERTHQTLQAGVERMKSTGKTSSLVLAILCQAELALDDGDPDRAHSLLTDTVLGPVRLAEQQDRTTAGLEARIFKAQLECQLEQLAAGKAVPQREFDSTIEHWSRSLADSPDKNRYVRAAISEIRRDLKRQLDALPQRAQEQFAQALTRMLDQVRSDVQDSTLQFNVADCYSILGESLRAADGRDSALANKLLATAGEMFAALSQAAANGSTADPSLRMQIDMRTARVMQQSGNIDAALDAYEKILVKRNTAITVQIDAARALQSAGDQGQPEYYVQAAKGTRRSESSGKNTIWGWEKIARVVHAQIQRQPEQRARYEDHFFDAQLNFARCRLGQALAAPPEGRQKYLASALRIVNTAMAAYADMGNWREEFEQLKTNIEQAEDS